MIDAVIELSETKIPSAIVVIFLSLFSFGTYLSNSKPISVDLYLFFWSNLILILWY